MGGPPSGIDGSDGGEEAQREQEEGRTPGRAVADEQAPAGGAGMSSTANGRLGRVWKAQAPRAATRLQALGCETEAASVSASSAKPFVQMRVLSSSSSTI